MARKALPNISSIENKINTSLYGGKSFFRGIRDTKYRAEVISCDCEHCSFREKGMCLKVTSVLSHFCEYGKKYIFEGYTPQAMACHEWLHVFRSDETYGKLSYVPSDIRFGVIGEYYFINTTFVGVTWKENGEYAFETTTGPKSHVFIKKEDINVDFLEDLLSYKPYALMGGVIREYQESIVPMILRQMRALAPELFSLLTETYPHFADIVPNFVGKTVYVKTLKPDIDIRIQNSGTFHLSADRKTLTCTDYHSSFLPFGAKTSQLVIPVTDEMTYKVQSNSEITDDTEIAR